MVQARSSILWPCLLALPPLAAILAGIVTIILLSRHPDQELHLPNTAPLTQAEQRHVTNSVVPPLK